MRYVFVVAPIEEASTNLKKNFHFIARNRIYVY